SPPHLEESEALLRRALELDPTDLETQHLLIRCLERQGHSKEAQAMQKQEDTYRTMLKRVTETLKQDSITDPAAMTEVGSLFLRAHNEQNERLGLYWLNRALDTDPDYQPALRALVEHYEKNGQETKAAAHRRRLRVEKTTASP